MKKVLCIITAAVLMAMLITACGGTQAPTTTQAATTADATTAAQAGDTAEEISGKVLVWTFLDPDGGQDARSQALAKMIQSFETENPKVDVVTEPQSWEMLVPMFLANAASGSASDIIWTRHDDVPLILNTGNLLAFEDSFMADWSQEEIEDIRSSVFEVYVDDVGKHYVKDFGVGAYVVFYRKDLFAEKGIEGPFETWDELIAAAKQLNGVDANGIEVFGLGTALSPLDGESTVLHTYMTTQMGGKMFNDDGTAAWNGPEALEALQFQKSLIFDHKIVPESAIGYTSSADIIPQFIAGKYAMVVIQSPRLAQIRSGVSVCDPLDIEMMPLPKTDGKDTYHGLAGWTIGMNKYSKNIPAASKFFEYLISPEGDAIWSLEAGMNPSRKSTLETHAEFFNQPENEYYKVVNHVIGNYGFEPINPMGYSISGWINDICKAVEDSTIGGMTEQQALDASVESYNLRNAK